MESEVGESSYFEQVRNTVEEVLQNNLGNEKVIDVYKWYRHKLSTYPEKVSSEINGKNLSYTCGALSIKLRRMLIAKGLSTEIYYVDHANPLDHVYLIAKSGQEEVL